MVCKGTAFRNNHLLWRIEYWQLYWVASYATANLLQSAMVSIVLDLEQSPTLMILQGYIRLQYLPGTCQSDLRCVRKCVSS